MCPGELLEVGWFQISASKFIVGVYLLQSSSGFFEVGSVLRIEQKIYPTEASGIMQYTGICFIIQSLTSTKILQYNTHIP